MSLRQLNQVRLSAQRKHWVVPFAGNRVLMCLERIRYRLNRLGCGDLSRAESVRRGVLWEDCGWWVAREESGKTLGQGFRQLDVSSLGRHGCCRLSWWKVEMLPVEVMLGINCPKRASGVSDMGLDRKSTRLNSSHWE